MSHIRSALAAGLLVFGSAVVASAQTAKSAPQAGAPHAHTQRGREFGPGKALRGQLFKGITLSDAEKTNLKNVQTKYAAQMKALRGQSKPQMDEMRAARQRGDTAAVRALRDKNAGQREKIEQIMLAERNDLRGALSPENRAKFDANVAALKTRVADRGDRADRTKAGKGGRRGETAR